MKKSRLCHRHPQQLINFDRYELCHLTLKDLYIILSNKKYALFFVVFKNNHGLDRVKIDRVTSKECFNDLISKSRFKKIETGVNSEDFDILEASYIDCYYPI